MQPSDTGLLVRHALDLLSRGIICVPLHPDGRHLDVAAMGYAPLHLRTRRRQLKELIFQSIAFELSQHPPAVRTVRDWFQREDHALGVITGHRGLLALDFDERDAFDAWRRSHQALVDAAPLQETPKGVHLFVRCGAPIISSSLYHRSRKVGHIKALGGYITVEARGMPCGSPYRWMAGGSLTERNLPDIPGLEAIGLQPASPLKRAYDRTLQRGGF